MAETLVSPGVIARENDRSAITQGPVTVGAAIVGPTVMGPVEVPTVVTSYTDYVATFGDTLIYESANYSYYTSIAAFNYFDQGGTSLLVTRVTSGSFSGATSTPIITSDSNAGGLIEDVDELLGSISTPLGIAVTSSARTFTSVGLTTISGSGSGAEVSVTINSGSNAIDSITVTEDGSGYEVGDILAISSGSISNTGSAEFTLVADDIKVDELSFTLTTLTEGEVANSSGSVDANGAIDSGSRDNLRYEITNPNTDAGTFTLLVRRGDDTTAAKTILETWNNLSLDPISDRYIERVIGNISHEITTDGSDTYLRTIGEYTNNSRYVRVSAVNTATPNYFDNNGEPKANLTGKLPIAQNGMFQNATGKNLPTGRAANFYENVNSTDSQGLIGSDYDDVLALLSNQDDYKYNILTLPGLTRDNAASQISTMVSNVQSRGDAIAVVDLVNHNSTVSQVTTAAAAINNSYAASYWPWVQLLDPGTGKRIWAPASVVIPGVYANTDVSSEAWFAPAGLTRGGLGNVTRAERKLPAATRDTLYEANVNPIATFPQSGVVVFGQKTLQKKATALDRVNVRRLLIELKGFISQVADTLVFEQNSTTTRSAFLNVVNPYLSSVQARQGLFSYRVIMDDTNNTADVIDRNELVGQIYLQPTRTAEFILLDFNVQPTGATFGA